MKSTQTISWDVERGYLARGIRHIVGIDEAGRGPLAGPVVAAAVMFPLSDELPSDCFKLDDSKKLSVSERESLYEFICTHALGYGIGIVSASEVDEINILQATMRAMTNAVHELVAKVRDRTPEILIVDGNYFRTTLQYPSKTFVRGDGISPSIAAASILAKVTRDRMMTDLHETHPEYNFRKNKGYATKEHRDAICRYGLSSAHRKSFKLKANTLLEFDFGK